MPVVNSRMPTIGTVILQQTVNALNARPAGALLDTPRMVLFTAGPLPMSPDAVLANFTLCTFDGYAPVNPVYSVPILLPSTLGWGTLGPATFVCTGGTVAENVLGYALFDASDNFLMGEYFDAPIPMQTVGNFIDLQSVFPLAFAVDVQD